MVQRGAGGQEEDTDDEQPSAGSSWRNNAEGTEMSSSQTGRASTQWHSFQKLHDIQLRHDV